MSLSVGIACKRDTVIVCLTKEKGLISFSLKSVCPPHCYKTLLLVSHSHSRKKGGGGRNNKMEGIAPTSGKQNFPAIPNRLPYISVARMCHMTILSCKGAWEMSLVSWTYCHAKQFQNSINIEKTEMTQMCDCDLRCVFLTRG